MSEKITYIPEILMPKDGLDLKKWSVVACDQYTSEPEYWEQVDSLVGSAPSSLRITLPEVFLHSEDVAARTETIHQTMSDYLKSGILTHLPKGMILTERQSGGAYPRRGLVMAVDLEAYDYREGSTSLIRPTEKTVVERIPPRLAVRKGAVLELPHIMLLIDDPKEQIIEPLFEKADSFRKVYDTELMMEGGSIKGWFIPKGEDTDQVEDALFSLHHRDHFKKKYGCETEPTLAFAVGDGNHSMACAKAYWEEVKSRLSKEEQEDHPARYALVEIVNIHDKSLEIEPIHRVVFDVDAKACLDELIAYYKQQGVNAYVETDTDSASVNSKEAQVIHRFPYLSGTTRGALIVEDPIWSIPAATIQTALDEYLGNHSGSSIDYIHGSRTVENLAKTQDRLGFLLPDISKADLFRGVIFDGVLLRKTFSMGEAHEKRFYMECKSIVE